MSIQTDKLNEIQRAVIARLDEEYQSCRTAGSHGTTFNGPVLNVLKGFCASDAEFAQLLHDSDKTLKGCFEAVSRQGYSGTSDFEVYSNAIRYYLPGVTVHMTLWVDMQGVDEGVAFGRDGEATLDVYGKGKVKERTAAEDKPSKAKVSKQQAKNDPSQLQHKNDTSKGAKVLDMPKQQTTGVLEDEDDLLTAPSIKKSKILSFDFLDL